MALRRLVLEFPREEIGKIAEEKNPFQNVRSIEILHFLRQAAREFSVICRVDLEANTSANIQQVLSRNQNVSVQILEQEGKSGAFIVFIKGKPRRRISPKASFLDIEGSYLVGLEINQARIRLTHIGDERQFKKTFERLQKAKIQFRIVSLTDARFSPESPLNALTEKQRLALIMAYKLGYYDIPRKISSEQLARKLDIHGSALIAHRRKAELRLIREVLRGKRQSPIEDTSIKSGMT